MTRGEIVEIKSRDYWFKIVEFLQQNGALIDQRDSGVVVWFFGDTAGVFDELNFKTEADAIRALKKKWLQAFRRRHQSPRIYCTTEAAVQ